jgi:hypothetical protein
MLVADIALVVDSVILADNNPEVVSRVFHRIPPSPPPTRRSYLYAKWLSESCKPNTVPTIVK